jgi:hypothetical protein
VPLSHCADEPCVTWPTSTARRAAGLLDTRDDFGLHAERAHEAVEEGHDDDVGLPRFNELDGATKAGTTREGRAATDVELFQHVDDGEPVALTGRLDTLALF